MPLRHGHRRTRPVFFFIFFFGGGGGVRSFARIFYPVLARKPSGLALIVRVTPPPPKIVILKYSRRGGLHPPPPLVRLWSCPGARTFPFISTSSHVLRNIQTVLNVDLDLAPGTFQENDVTMLSPRKPLISVRVNTIVSWSDLILEYTSRTLNDWLFCAC